METSIQKVGNGVGVILPAPLLNRLHLKIGQRVQLEASDGCLVITPIGRKSYALKDFLAQCDEKAPPPADTLAWENAGRAGHEAP